MGLLAFQAVINRWEEYEIIQKNRRFPLKNLVLSGNVVIFANQ